MQTRMLPLIVAPVLKGKRGNPMSFSNHFKTQLLEHNAPDGCKEIVMEHSNQLLTVELTTQGIFQDIDYWEDYKTISEGGFRIAE